MRRLQACVREQFQKHNEQRMLARTELEVLEREKQRYLRGDKTGIPSRLYEAHGSPMTPIQMSRVSAKWYGDLKSRISDLQDVIVGRRIIYFH